jgi:hypothetical protein
MVIGVSSVHSTGTLSTITRALRFWMGSAGAGSLTVYCSSSSSTRRVLSRMVQASHIESPDRVGHLKSNVTSIYEPRLLKCSRATKSSMSLFLDNNRLATYGLHRRTG